MFTNLFNVVQELIERHETNFCDCGVVFKWSSSQFPGLLSQVCSTAFTCLSQTSTDSVLWANTEDPRLKQQKLRRISGDETVILNKGTKMWQALALLLSFTQSVFSNRFLICGVTFWWASAVWLLWMTLCPSASRFLTALTLTLSDKHTICVCDCVYVC